MQKLLLTSLFLSFFCSLSASASNGPNIQCPANLTVTVTDINCRASVDFPAVYVGSNCSFIASVEAFWLDNGISKSLLATLEFDMDSTGIDTLAVLGAVTDFPIGTTTILYVVTDDCGNSSECSFELAVLGSALPSCTAPADINVACTAFDPTLALYGGVASQSCSVDSVQTLVDWSSFDTVCVRGTLVRQFQVFDSAGQMGACSQKIVVNYAQDYYIRFPNDVIATDCNTTGIYGEPTFVGHGCELLSLSYHDAIIDAVPDACYKIERIWQLINWCTYNPGLGLINVPNPNPHAIANHASNLPGPIVSNIQTQGDPWKSTIVKINPTDPAATNYSIYYDTNTNGYQYKQSIKIIDTQAPTVLNCPSTVGLTVSDTTLNDPELWNELYWWNSQFESHNLSEAPTELTITATDACSGSNINIEFDLFLDLDDDGVVETVVKSNQLGNQSGGLGWNNVRFGNFSGPGLPRQFDERNVLASQKWGFSIQEAISGIHKTASVKFNTFDNPSTYLPLQLPHGRHKIKWYVTDGCGNEKVCEYSFLVQDGQAPVVTCKTGLTFSLTPICYIQLLATEVLLHAEDNCTPDPYLVYGIRKAGTGFGFPTDAQGNPVTTVPFVGADDVGLHNVELWCKDKAGNTSFCQTTVFLQDNTGTCEPNNTLDISGYIKTELDEGIKDVRINFVGTVNFAPPVSYFLNGTDSAGYYALQNSIPISSSLLITPVKDDQPLNGVTSYDLTLISRHILDTEPLNDPYKLIAADANKNGSISTFDIIEFRKLILGIYQEMPANTSWRFVPKSYVFPNPKNPFMPAFPEQISLAQVLQDVNNGNFVGIKIGDVNNSAVPHVAGPTDERSAGIQQLTVDGRRWTVDGGRRMADGRVEVGETVDITFSSEQSLEACQFTLNTYGLEVLDILPGENMAREHFALFPEKNALTMAWEKGGMVNFTLKCKASEAGNIREMLRIGSAITKAEAYRENSSGQVERSELALRFPEQGSFELFQNRPNPFAGATEISFNLPEASTVTLKIYDVNGRVLYTQTGAYAQGVNAISIEKAALEAKGVFYYQVETAKGSATRKMIKI